MLRGLAPVPRLGAPLGDAGCPLTQKDEEPFLESLLFQRKKPVLLGSWHLRGA